jgi:3-dehydroquinate synthase
MQKKEESERLRNLLNIFNLPVYAAEKFSSRGILRAMKHDKKAVSGKLSFVLPKGIGKAEIVKDIPEKLILKALDLTRIK